MNKAEMIDLLTGVKSSKKSYYTELKETVLELQKKNMQLEIINEVTKGFNVDTSMDVMLHNILEKLNQIFTLERLYLAVVDHNQLLLANVYPLDSSKLQRGTIFPKENSLFQTVFETKQPVTKHIIPNKAEKMFFEDAILTQTDAQFFILYPLVCKGEVIGVFGFESNHQFDFAPGDYVFFQQLSDQLAACIENMNLYHAVLKSKKQWEETFRSVPSMIFVIDRNERITLCNEAVNRFVKLDDPSIYQQTFHQLLEIDAKDSPLTEAYQTLKATSKQLTILNRICELHCYPSLNEKNVMTEIIVSMNDITEKLQIEGQLIHSGKLAAIGEMAAGVAHELNNPLTAVLGNSQLLLRTTNKEKVEYKLLEDIQQCGIRCKHIISSLLTFSRQDEYVFQECSLNKAVEQVLNLVRYQIERQNIQIELHLDHHVSTINGSLQQIEQIAINLLLNAKQALEEMEVDNKKIVIETCEMVIEQQKKVCLRITDNGAGIKAPDIQTIFNPFFTTKKATKGSGLGLSVSLGIAKAHGGTIEVESKEGKGSVFTLVLPKKE
ncbi:GAF domain-containing sensor histidine kinase [Caldalkalibacillus mannanilyticus]|uniref:GAF domain-containing sensor histidine kinase n=1 Tax=Caldalkalibacillus mannanilyticus TaxID=1418 RepID=UPI0034E214FD